MKTLTTGVKEMRHARPARRGETGEWQRWAPYAALAWSLVYAALGIYWLVSGHGFPYAGGSGPNGVGAMLGHFQPGVAWFGSGNRSSPRVNAEGLPFPRVSAAPSNTGARSRNNAPGTGLYRQYYAPFRALSR